MAKLVDAERLKKKIQAVRVSMVGVRFGKTVIIQYLKMYLDAILKIIDEEPEMDTERHGRNLKSDYPSLFECSECFWSCWDTMCGDTEVYNYCPNCGARMDGE